MLALFLGLVVALVATRLSIPLISPQPKHINHQAPDLAPHTRNPNFVTSVGTPPPARATAALDADFETVVQALEATPRTELVFRSDTYAHFVATTPVWGFRDDVQILKTEGRVDVKSSARLGVGDFDTNRKRVEKLRKRLTP